MATIKQVIGTRTYLSVGALQTLANGTYTASKAYVPNTNQPLDVIVELMVGTTNTPAGNKQVIVFAIESMNGTNFRSGPVSGTTSIDEVDLTYLGTVPLNTSVATRLHTGFFSLANAFGYIPHTYKVVIKNDCGVALTTASATYAEVSFTIT